MPPRFREILLDGVRRRRRPARRATVRSAVHPQVLLEQLPQVRTLSRDLGQLLQRRECLLDLPGLLHPFGEFEEVLLRLTHEPLRGV